MDISVAILQKSQDFLTHALRDEDTFDEIDFFEKLPPQALLNLLENEKKVFWLNVYNAFAQLELSKMRGNQVDRSLFTQAKFSIGGERLNLDEIEHGILRGNYWKYGLGYLPGKYLRKTARNWKCRMLDYRIHFQLNCGAASCPLIRVLSAENLQEELERGEQDFIRNETKVDETKRRLLVSGLFLFYLKDFGGRKGIQRLVRRYFPDPRYKIGFSSFDWTKQPKKIAR